MAGMAMPDMAPAASGTSAGARLAVLFGMWAVMMAGMMLPSVTPMLLLYARVAAHAARRGHAFASTGWFAGGYLLAWTGFAALAALLQSALASAALLTAMMASASRWLTAAVLIAAGLYQWTPLKQACLAQCQAPFLFVQRNGGFRPDPAGALSLGLRHGLYCVGCCWALMLLLFVGGVMNLLWVAALALLVLAEKLLPWPRAFSRLTGALMLLAGGLLLASS